MTTLILRRLTTTLAATSLALAAAVIPAPLARAQEGAEAAPQPPKPVIAFEHTGLKNLLPDEKDAGLVNAISMLSTRFRELKAHPEFGRDLQQIPDQAITLVDTLMTSPMRMAVTLGEMDHDTNLPAIGLVISFEARDQDHARTLDNDIEHIRALTEMPFQPEQSERWNSMHQLTLPVGMLSYGPRKADDGWRYEFIYGAVQNPDAVTSYLPDFDPDIRQPGARAMFDFAALTPVTEMVGGMAAMFAPQGNLLMQRARDSGFVGPDAMTVHMTSGYTKTHGVERYVVKRAGQYAESLGLVSTPLTPADLAVVPADATAAQIKKMDIQHTWQSIRTQIEQAGVEGKVDQFLTEFREQTGVDLEADLINAAGDTSVIYLSDSTGGGSFLSTVLALKLAEPQRFKDAFSKLTAVGNHAATQLDLGPGALHLETTNQGNAVSLTSVRVRGLPIPIQPTFAIANDWLIVGASASACEAGVAQVTTAKTSLKDNPNFKNTWPARNQPIAVSFIDTPKTLRSGYTALSLLGSAFSNFVASPDPNAQDPGPMLAAYPDFADGARPLVSYAYWSDQDLVISITADRSTLVNVAGLLGVGESGSLIMGAILGAGITAGVMEDQMSKHRYETHEHHETGSTTDNDGDHDEDVEY